MTLPQTTPQAVLAAARQCWQLGQPAVLVRVQRHRGSAPREADAAMLVWATGFCGTVGGGHLEWHALTRARESLSAPTDLATWHESLALGPSLGQCCGGRVELRYERLDSALLSRLDQAQQSLPLILICGAGHVGAALVGLLSQLPCRLRWADERLELMAFAPAGVQCDDDPMAALKALDSGARVFIMTHSHAMDFDLVRAAIARQEPLRSVGVIGSVTKARQFRRRLQALGLPLERIEALECPLGLAQVPGKQPAAVAVSIVARLLQDQVFEPGVNNNSHDRAISLSGSAGFMA
jgi:xanthine dehydrogenase accessory factor